MGTGSEITSPAPVIDRVAALLKGRRVTVLTGAGLSTDSGIPDYRGPHSPQRSPITITEFLGSAAARQRYWARSFLGWPRIHTTTPNPGHQALAEAQASGIFGPIITQNVDGLHQAAGATGVIDLHGRLDTVVCLDCGNRSPRAALQGRLARLNPELDPADVHFAPDGDAEYDDTADFTVAPCTVCGGTLKPDVVFFGENVPAGRVQASYAAVDGAETLLVAGSSLTVMSGFRFVKRAAGHGSPIVIVNRGATRGDDLAAVKIDAGCSETLTALVTALR